METLPTYRVVSRGPSIHNVVRWSPTQGDKTMMTYQAKFIADEIVRVLNSRAGSEV